MSDSIREFLTESQYEMYDLYYIQKKTPMQIATELDKNYNTVRSILRRVKKKIETLESQGVADIAQGMGIDLGHLHSGWVKRDDGSFYFMTPKEEANVEDFIEIVKEAFEYGKIKRAAPVKNKNTKSDPNLLTKYVLADLHMGMFAWAQETGEDYDLKIAEQTLIDSMTMLIQSTPNSETALILNLGDMFHANDSKGITPAHGHILDMDTRFSKIAITVVRAIKTAIELAAEKHQKVIYAGVPGNHDKDQAHWLTIALMEAYRDHDNIEVIYTGSDWFHYEHGKNMIVAHHGDQTNFQRLVMAAAEKYSAMWGRTYWRFLDTGHVHHQREHEHGGMLCRSYRTIAAKDSFAAKSGHVSKRSLTAQTLHKDRGEVNINNVQFYNGKVA